MHIDVRKRRAKKGRNQCVRKVDFKFSEKSEAHLCRSCPGTTCPFLLRSAPLASQRLPAAMVGWGGEAALAGGGRASPRPGGRFEEGALMVQSLLHQTRTEKCPHHSPPPRYLGSPRPSRRPAPVPHRRPWSGPPLPWTERRPSQPFPCAPAPQGPRWRWRRRWRRR